MNPDYSSLLIIIIPQVVKLISQYYQISQLNATRLFYKSKVYTLLANEETKFWHFSPLTLWTMFNDEYKTDAFEMPEEC
jgi:hypothetical protein